LFRDKNISLAELFLQLADPGDQPVVMFQKWQVAVNLVFNQRLVHEDFMSQSRVLATEGRVPSADYWQVENCHSFFGPDLATFFIPVGVFVRIMAEVRDQLFRPGRGDAGCSSQVKTVSFDELGCHHPGRRFSEKSRAWPEHGFLTTGRFIDILFLVNCQVRDEPGQDGLMGGGKTVGITGLGGLSPILDQPYFLFFQDFL